MVLKGLGGLLWLPLACRGLLEDGTADTDD